MAKEYFCAYHSYLNSMELLSDEEKGRLFTALLLYSSTGTIADLTGNERFVFPAMREQIDRDSKKYVAKCEKNRENIMQRYTNVNDRIRANTNATKEKEKEKEKTKTKEKEKENKGVPGGTPPPDKPARARFVPPDESEAIAYFRERGSNAQEAAAFLNYYTANGWMVGKNRMKDWRAAARVWMQRAGQYSGKAAAPQSGEEFTDQLTRVADQLASGNISILGGIYDNK